MKRSVVAAVALFCMASAAAAQGQNKPPLNARETKQFVRACQTMTAEVVASETKRLKTVREFYAKTNGTTARQEIARIERHLQEFRDGHLLSPLVSRPLKVGQIGSLYNIEGLRELVDDAGRKELADGDVERRFRVWDGKNFDNSSVVIISLVMPAKQKDIPLFVRITKLEQKGIGEAPDIPATAEVVDTGEMEKLLPKGKWFVPKQKAGN